MCVGRLTDNQSPKCVVSLGTNSIFKGSIKNRPGCFIYPYLFLLKSSYTLLRIMLENCMHPPLTSFDM